jgi:hypothetical protein
MPLHSQAQRRYFYWAERKGKLPKGTAAKWEAHTPDPKSLPERVAPEKKAAIPPWIDRLAEAAYRAFKTH